MVEIGEIAQVKINLNAPGEVSTLEINGQLVKASDYTLEKGEAGEYDTLHIISKCQGIIEGTCRVVQDIKTCPYGWIPPEQVAQLQRVQPKAVLKTVLAETDVLRNKITDLKATIDQKTAKIDELQATVDTKVARIDELVAAAAVDAQKITDLQATVAAKNTKITEMQTTIDTKVAKITELQLNLDQKNQRITYLQGKLDAAGITY